MCVLDLLQILSQDGKFIIMMAHIPMSSFYSHHFGKCEMNFFINFSMLSHTNLTCVLAGNIYVF
uniref:Uncharacterized protein n=1 Tax=Anguilla anguilla TaxID=7936 RepID=A0A0E9XEF3_ANGAN